MGSAREVRFVCFSVIWDKRRDAKPQFLDVQRDFNFFDELRRKVSVGKN